MNTGARQSFLVPEQGQKKTRSNGDLRVNVGNEEMLRRQRERGAREANLGCSSQRRIGCCGKRWHGCW